MATLAFLGTGNMGFAMAGRLIDAGHEVRVYNRTSDKAAPMAERGAMVAATPKDAAAGAEAVFAMLSDDEASRAVWLGETGALAAAVADNSLTNGAIIIECSTLSHGWVLELARTVQAKGLRYIDCPATGIPVTAEAGELTLLVGADEKNLAAARPFLEPLSKDIIRFGDVGAGAQARERPDNGAVGDFRPLDMTKGADDDIVADVNAGPEHHIGADGDVLAQRGVEIKRDGVGVQQRRTCIHGGAA